LFTPPQHNRNRGRNQPRPHNIRTGSSQWQPGLMETGVGELPAAAASVQRLKSGRAGKHRHGGTAMNRMLSHTFVMLTTLPLAGGARAPPLQRPSHEPMSLRSGHAQCG